MARGIPVVEATEHGHDGFGRGDEPSGWHRYGPTLLRIALLVLLVLAGARGGSPGEALQAGAGPAPGATPPGASATAASSPAPDAPAATSPSMTTPPATPPPPDTASYDATAPEVPFIDQYDPAGRDASYDGTENCGPAIVAGIAKARGQSFNLSDASLITLLGAIAGTGPNGTTGHGMIDALQAPGCRPTRARARTWTGSLAARVWAQLASAPPLGGHCRGPRGRERSSTWATVRERARGSPPDAPLPAHSRT